MKALLTSAGILNSTIARSLIDLTGLYANEIKIIVIPTAASVEVGDIHVIFCKSEDMLVLLATERRAGKIYRDF